MIFILKKLLNDVWAIKQIYSSHFHCMFFLLEFMNFWWIYDEFEIHTKIWALIRLNFATQTDVIRADIFPESTYNAIAA